MFIQVQQHLYSLSKYLAFMLTVISDCRDTLFWSLNSLPAYILCIVCILIF